ncbi:hypothetical protein RF11_13369 [Thelohanellus kitauei]|uniref:Tc1-like transposase DDE domain-containing protein n=1 Tax=Thelohanellus kitauei TaxID=669202 RepID=A0A0C2N2Y7_THEKT|nr:hypothetical protein RF11_13369 [Thelohanellus kitauei]
MHECISIMEKVSFLKSNKIHTMLQENDRRMIYLPPHPPFLNPIENLLSKCKKIVRKTSSRSETDIFNRKWLNIITPSDSYGYCRNMQNITEGVTYERKLTNEYMYNFF